MCPRRKIAQSVAITVSQAFNTAWEVWQQSELQSKMAQIENSSPDALKLTDDEDDRDDGKNILKRSFFFKLLCYGINIFYIKLHIVEKKKININRVKF